MKTKHKGLLCKMVGSSTCRIFFLSYTICEILTDRHYPQSPHSPFSPIAVKRYENDIAIAAATNTTTTTTTTPNL